MGKNKIVGIFVCIILIGNVLPVSGTNSVRNDTYPMLNGKTFFVGGDEPGNYSKIQDAIDNASDGDTVFVYNGSYGECLIINKSITVIGEDRNNTVIDGTHHQNNTVCIRDADRIYFSGFTIQNSGKWRGLEVHSSYNNISNNIVSPNTESIEFYRGTENNVFFGNNISTSVSFS